MFFANPKKFAISLIFSALLSGITVNARASCEREIPRYCNDVIADGEIKIVGCLAAVRSNLSVTCREYVQSVLDGEFAMIKNCGEEIREYCTRSTERHRKIFPECLIEKKDYAYQKCRNLINDYVLNLESRTVEQNQKDFDPTARNEVRATMNACLSILSVMPIMQHNSMKMYLTDWKKKENPKIHELVDRIETLSKAGNGDASYTLGALLQGSSCVQTNKNLSIQYYKKAVDQGNKEAARMLEK